MTIIALFFLLLVSVIFTTTLDLFNSREIKKLRQEVDYLKAWLFLDRLLANRKGSAEYVKQFMEDDSHE
ncbi:hypothetical protein LFL96_26005 [Paraburkholderia sp. D15]|uniref:hypothetical protein n=1 Tax=Paraburkholderia sp. D15 TaxID=2880218 RepID=UPI00247A119E|nr:hypothetical protein [Paraburkholderia sp. D15]WGS54471.1 hypothetical protein LFL96_26005 [Paraburkholderia sp. D15]